MKSNTERLLHKQKVSLLKLKLTQAGVKFIPNQTHIVPIIIGDAKRAKLISTQLIQKHKIYVQHINYPTVPIGTERLRVTITPHHTHQMIDDFVAALLDVGLGS
jgi:5-aminolevulinate synthase